MSIFAKRLLELRKENDMTQDEVCEQLKIRFDYDINKSTLSRYEKGIHEPNYYFVQLAAQLFGVSSDYLMGRTDNKYSGVKICQNLKKFSVFILKSTCLIT